MTAEEYKQIALDIKRRFGELDNNSTNQTIDEIKRDFIHLVYNYDSQLPMYQEMMSRDREYPGLIILDRRFSYFVDYFINYLETYEVV